MWLNAKCEDREQFDEEVGRVCKTYEQAQSLREEGVNTISTDEKTGIQALERAAQDKPMKPGIAQRIEYEYIRHGTQALIASFEVATGELIKGSVVNERTEKEFAAHIVGVMSANPEAGWIFVTDLLLRFAMSLILIKVPLSKTGGGIALPSAARAFSTCPTRLEATSYLSLAAPKFLSILWSAVASCFCISFLTSWK